MAGTMVLTPRFNPTSTLMAMTTHDANVLSAVPVMLQRILDLPADDDPPLPSLRLVATSGSAYPTGLATRWMDRFGDDLHNVYGSSEVALATIAGPADLRADPATAGRPPPGTVVRIVDEAGHEVTRGRSGRILVGSSMAFDGYTDGGDRPRHGGLVEIGDNGHVDSDGRLVVEGRADDMIISGGENVAPGLTEDTIEAHPSVAEAAAIGVPDDDFGQRLVVFVVLIETGHVTAEELKTHVGNQLSRHQVPREIVIIDDLPRNETGKVVRRSLVDGYQP
jgi:fatty-acyl-CoA synthase